MRDIEKYIQGLDIVDVEKGLNEENEELFDFPDSQYRLLNKCSMVLLCIEVGLFSVWYKMQSAYSNSALFYVLTFVLAFVALAYQYETRNVRYYKKARKGARSNALGYCLKYTNKIVNSSAIYLTDMPLVYYLLKAENLIKQNRILECEVLAEEALENFGRKSELCYFLGLCAYVQNEDEKAKNYMLKVRDGKCIQAKIKTNAQKILNDIS